MDRRVFMAGVIPAITLPSIATPTASKPLHHPEYVNAAEENSRWESIIASLERHPPTDLRLTKISPPAKPLTDNGSFQFFDYTTPTHTCPVHGDIAGVFYFPGESYVDQDVEDIAFCPSCLVNALKHFVPHIVERKDRE